MPPLENGRLDRALQQVAAAEAIRRHDEPQRREAILDAAREVGGVVTERRLLVQEPVHHLHELAMRRDLHPGPAQIDPETRCRVSGTAFKICSSRCS